jgi:hypothetical protein
MHIITILGYHRRTLQYSYNSINYGDDLLRGVGDAIQSQDERCDMFNT